MFSSRANGAGESVGESHRGVIFDIKQFSLHDGPGIRTTVFFKGCSLRCAWCHNPESISPAREVMYWQSRCAQCGTCMDECAQQAIVEREDGVIATNADLCVLCGECVEACPYGAREITGREVTVQDVMAAIEKDIVFYDESGGGVTLSGGEPLLQPTFLSALLGACKAQDIHTALDTTGFANSTVLDRVRDDVDLFLYDLKLMDSDRHRQHTGVPNEVILKNLRWLSFEGHTITIRVPIIPGVNDDAENIRQTGMFVSSLPNAHQVDILPYHRMAQDKYARLHIPDTQPDVAPPSPDKMQEIADVLRGYGLKTTIGGQ